MGKTRKDIIKGTLGEELYQQRREGLIPRSKSWSRNGEKNDARKNRREFKQQLRQNLDRD